MTQQGTEAMRDKHAIPVGSKWRDNDPRSKHRVVRVTEVSDAFVWYRFVCRCRSRRARFLKAFTRVEP